MAKDVETKGKNSQPKGQTKAQAKAEKANAKAQKVQEEQEEEEEEYDGLLSEKTESRLGMKDIEQTLYDRLNEDEGMEGVTHAITKAAVSELFDILYGEMVINKNSISVVNFGTFYPKFKDFRERRNPKLPVDAPLVQVKPSISLKFAGTNWAVYEEELDSWRAFDSAEPKEEDATEETPEEATPEAKQEE